MLDISQSHCDWASLTSRYEMNMTLNQITFRMYRIKDFST